MIDREKVIRELQAARLFFKMSSNRTDHVIGHSECESGIKYINDALSLFKEQEAIPVKQCELAHMLFWCCGSCGVAITDGDKFCRNCGREVKWK